MQDEIAAVIADVETECRRREIPMIGPQKAAFLVKLIREARPERVLEIGTAIGYSGLWIAHTLEELDTGRLVTIEQDAGRAAEAVRAFRRAGLEQRVTQLVGDARELVKTVEGPVDFLFLDGGFANYHPCFLGVRPRLRAGALLVADNAGIGADEMADYLAHVRQHYLSRTEWFDTDLPWNPRDAMEVSIYHG
jgi:predicted O-methyltransferase YrrM